MDPILIKKETNFCVSVQAQQILAQTKYTIEQLIEWVQKSPTPIGGNDVMFFLSDMSKEEVKNGSTPSG